MKSCQNSRGFSTLEIMIALALMMVTLTAVVQIIFGNQKILEESQMNAEALSHAQAAIEQEESLARKDFELVSSTATTTDDEYQTAVSVDVWPQDLYTTKHVTVKTWWQDESGVEREVELSTLVTNYQSTLGGDTCDLPSFTNPPSGISNYQLTLGTLLPWVAPSGHTFATNNPVAALDVSQGLLAITVASTSLKTNDKLFLFTVADPLHAPQYLGSINNATNTTDGIGAVRLAGTYAYVGSAHDPNFKTCKPSANCAQLQIFDISNPTNITNVSNFLLPTSTPPYVWGNVSSANQAIGKSIYYANGYIYLGLSKTAHGPEFNIIDVHDPLHPVWMGGYAVGATVSAVVVKNNIAYLATDDGTRDLIILDVHDPTNPTLTSIYNAPDPSGWSNGRSLSIIGSTLFLGLTYATSSPELYELAINNPQSPSYLASLTPGSTVTGIVSRNGASYFVTSTTGQLQTLAVDTQKNIATTSVQVLPGVGAALDCERGVLYVGSNTGGKGYVSVTNATP